jgi:SMODS and SLOG-associating 2TM effector domain 1/SMODS and SLOG-associating 2TM effector domain 3
MEFPDLYNAVEEVSMECQSRVLQARSAEYLAFVIAGGFGELPRKAFFHAGATIAVIAFVAALVIRLSGVGDDAEKRWYDARAAAESIKSASWQFAVAGGAYPLSDTEATAHFNEMLQSVLDSFPDLNSPASSGNSFAVSPEMTRLRGESQSDRLAAYKQDRVQDQLNWYIRKAKWNKQRAKRWRNGLVVIDGCAIGLGLMRALGVFDFNWLGVLAALAASVAAWQQTKKFAELSESYSVTSHEVNLVSSTLAAGLDEESWAESIHSAELAFSREHTLWLARRQHRPQLPGHRNTS